MIKFNLRKLTTQNHAVAGVVVGLLFIGLIFSAIGFVQTVYVPQWMEEKEAEHMDQVANQFSQLKFAIDTQSVLEKTNTVISNPITLGSKEMPFLSSSRSYGAINMDPNDCTLKITDGVGEVYEYTLGSLVYSSQNAYYINQIYSYETGGIILNQNEGDIFLIDPTISVVNKNGLVFDLTRLVEKTGITSNSGYGTHPIKTRFIESESFTIWDIDKIELYNSHLDAWKKFFEKLLDPSVTDFDCNIFFNTDVNGIQIVEIDFLPRPSGIASEDSKRPEMSLTVSHIEVQVSPGWVE